MNNYTKNRDLVDLIILRNPIGYTMLVENYSSALYGSIMRMVKDTKTAEHLLGLTFYKICNGIAKYNADHLTFLSWVLQLAGSTSIDYLCINRQHIGITNHFTGNHENLSANIELIIMPAAENDETATLNSIMEGYKVSEIATKLNLSVETVKTNIRKGLKFKKTNN